SSQWRQIPARSKYPADVRLACDIGRENANARSPRAELRQYTLCRRQRSTSADQDDRVNAMLLHEEAGCVKADHAESARDEVGAFGMARYGLWSRNRRRVPIKTADIPCAPTQRNLCLPVRLQ